MQKQRTGFAFMDVVIDAALVVMMNDRQSRQQRLIGWATVMRGVHDVHARAAVLCAPTLRSAEHLKVEGFHRHGHLRVMRIGKPVCLKRATGYEQPIVGVTRLRSFGIDDRNQCSINAAVEDMRIEKQQ
ncbi:hypothetical protein ALP75_200887 [Pseudomonas syringae pv. actinidiae]|nr:hypothetical protein ALP75_200887 [Pseudomonas syringae pv. actinidiae]